MMNENKNGKCKCLLLILLIAIVAILAGLAVLFLFDQPEKQEAPVEVELPFGSRSVYNPFHHADSGDWEMLQTTAVLKEDKFVSSRRELMEYLVKEVPAGTVLRITAPHGRWKEVVILEDGRETLRGWVDGEKAPGKEAATTQPAKNEK